MTDQSHLVAVREIEKVKISCFPDNAGYASALATMSGCWPITRT